MATIGGGVAAPTFAFGTDCATTCEITRPELQAIVAIENHGIVGTTYGDRCFRQDLNNDGVPELFLLLHCATTNCAWAVVEEEPFRDLGRVWAEIMYVVPSEGPWPTILAMGRHGEFGWSSEYLHDGRAFVQGVVKELTPMEKQQLLKLMGPLKCE